MVLTTGDVLLYNGDVLDYVVFFNLVVLTWGRFDLYFYTGIGQLDISVMNTTVVEQFDL